MPNAWNFGRIKLASAVNEELIQEALASGEITPEEAEELLSGGASVEEGQAPEPMDDDEEFAGEDEAIEEEDEAAGEDGEYEDDDLEGIVAEDDEDAGEEGEEGEFPAGEAAEGYPEEEAAEEGEYPAPGDFGGEEGEEGGEFGEEGFGEEGDDPAEEDELSEALDEDVIAIREGGRIYETDNAGDLNTGGYFGIGPKVASDNRNRAAAGTGLALGGLVAGSGLGHAVRDTRKALGDIAGKKNRLTHQARAHGSWREISNVVSNSSGQRAKYPRASSIAEGRAGNVQQLAKAMSRRAIGKGVLQGAAAVGVGAALAKGVHGKLKKIGPKVAALTYDVADRVKNPKDQELIRKNLGNFERSSLKPGISGAMFGAAAGAGALGGPVGIAAGGALGYGVGKLMGSRQAKRQARNATAFARLREETGSKWSNGLTNPVKLMRIHSQLRKEGSDRTKAVEGASAAVAGAGLAGTGLAGTHYGVPIAARKANQTGMGLRAKGMITELSGVRRLLSGDRQGFQSARKKGKVLKTIGRAVDSAGTGLRRYGKPAGAALSVAGGALVGKKLYDQMQKRASYLPPYLLSNAEADFTNKNIPLVNEILAQKAQELHGKGLNQVDQGQWQQAYSAMRRDPRIADPTLALQDRAVDNYAEGQRKSTRRTGATLGALAGLGAGAATAANLPGKFKTTGGMAASLVLPTLGLGLAGYRATKSRANRRAEGVRAEWDQIKKAFIVPTQAADFRPLVERDFKYAIQEAEDDTTNQVITGYDRDGRPIVRSMVDPRRLSEYMETREYAIRAREEALAILAQDEKENYDWRRARAMEEANDSRDSAIFGRTTLGGLAGGAAGFGAGKLLAASNPKLRMAAPMLAIGGAGLAGYLGNRRGHTVGDGYVNQTREVYDRLRGRDS
jgi:hypothetical protein